MPGNLVARMSPRSCCSQATVMEMVGSRWRYSTRGAATRPAPKITMRLSVGESVGLLWRERLENEMDGFWFWFIQIWG